MIILGNYKNNYDIATKTAQWALTPKQLSLVVFIFAILDFQMVWGHRQYLFQGRLKGVSMEFVFQGSG